MSFLGTFPVALDQLFGFGIVLLAFACFSTQNAKIGIVVGVIVAMFLTFIGWLDISWAWLSVTFAIAMVAVLSLAKRERGTSI